MKTENKMTLPEKLTFLRKQNGLTQIELAEKLNVSRQAISRWEVGTAVPSTDNLKMLSDLYCVSIDYLLNDISEPIQSRSDLEDKTSVQHSYFKQKKSWIIPICILLLITIIGVTIAVRQDQSKNEIDRIEDLATDIIEDFPSNTFRLE